MEARPASTLLEESINKRAAGLEVWLGICQKRGVLKLRFIHDVLISLALGTLTLIDCSAAAEQYNNIAW